MRRLCRRLELGLIFVGFSSAGVGQVDVFLHPAEARPPRKNAKKRLAILTEHAGRTGSHNTGGVTRKKILTVYKEQALCIARYLSDGFAAPAAIKAAGGPVKSGEILRRNYDGWFQRLEDKTYALTPAGREALETYADLLRPAADRQEAERGEEA